jgi:hypothetical protein
VKRIENEASNNSSIDARVFIAAVTYLPSRYLVKTGDTQTDERNLWNMTLRLAQVSMGYVTCFIKTGCH